MKSKLNLSIDDSIFKTIVEGVFYNFDGKPDKPYDYSNNHVPYLKWDKSNQYIGKRLESNENVEVITVKRGFWQFILLFIKDIETAIILIKTQRLNQIVEEKNTNYIKVLLQKNSKYNLEDKVHQLWFSEVDAIPFNLSSEILSSIERQILKDYADKTKQVAFIRFDVNNNQLSDIDFVVTDSFLNVIEEIKLNHMIPGIYNEIDKQYVSTNEQRKESELLNQKASLSYLRKSE